MKLAVDLSVNPKHTLGRGRERYLIKELCNKLSLNEESFVYHYSHYKPLGQIMWSLILAKRVNQKNIREERANIEKYIERIEVGATTELIRGLEGV